MARVRSLSAIVACLPGVMARFPRPAGRAVCMRWQRASQPLSVHAFVHGDRGFNGVIRFVHLYKRPPGAPLGRMQRGSWEVEVFLDNQVFWKESLKFP